MVVPTMDPHMTVATFSALNVNDKTSLALSEVVSRQIFLVVLPIVRQLIYILFLIDSLSCKSSNPSYPIRRKCTMASDRWCSKPRWWLQAWKTLHGRISRWVYANMGCNLSMSVPYLYFGAKGINVITFLLLSFILKTRLNIFLRRFVCNK